MAQITAEQLAGHDVLIHFAAAGVRPGQADWQSCFDVNLNKSLHLWVSAADAGVKRFVICGSCFEYGRAAERYDFIPPTAPLEPTGPYHASKAAASMAAYALGVQRKLQLAILRPFHVFGEGEVEGRFWPSLRKAAIDGRDLPMTPGEQIRDFVPVEFVAAAFLSEISSDLIPGAPRIANVGTGNAQSLRKFAEYWWARWNAPGRLLFGAEPYRADEVMRYVPLV